MLSHSDLHVFHAGLPNTRARVDDVDAARSSHGTNSKVGFTLGAVQKEKCELSA